MQQTLSAPPNEAALLLSNELPVLRAEHPPQLPLWLTEKEAELLLALCAASPVSGGDTEREIFVRLGEVLRAFWR